MFVKRLEECMKRVHQLMILSGLLLFFSSCGIAVYEESKTSSSRSSGQITVVNETYHEDIRVEVDLSDSDAGYISPLYVEPNSKRTRRYSYSTDLCGTSPYRTECKRKIQFFGDGTLRTYCYGRDVLKVDYTCDGLRCEPIQDDWSDVTCHQIN